jgi:1,2-diacylglycerol 3-alpha-glucosyltransferase
VPVLLSLSRVAYEKRIDRVVGAMPAHFSATTGNAVLLVVGDGPAKADLEAQAESLGIKDHVRFTGEVDHDDIADYYRAADVFVSASDSESQGLTYIEALAAGRKVVAFAGEYTQSLLDDPAIGTTLPPMRKWCRNVCNISSTHKRMMIPNHVKVNLQAISADQFGDSVLAFYQQAIAPIKPLMTKKMDHKKLRGNHDRYPHVQFCR